MRSRVKALIIRAWKGEITWHTTLKTINIKPWAIYPIAAQKQAIFLYFYSSANRYSINGFVSTDYQYIYYSIYFNQLNIIFNYLAALSLILHSHPLSLIIIMQSVVKDEPLTNGKVVVQTSHGELEIELWSKEAPLACKNFIQLSLDHYYDNTIFHRMIPGFMIQGGDPTGTGRGGQSSFGHPFTDEFHQRLKFTRRGIVAMANSGKNTNTSQFFLTFGECEHLNKKHTIFGKVVGDTIFNLMSLQSLDTDQTDRPSDPPIIRRVKVLLNPFDDVVCTIQNTKTQVNDQAAKIQDQSKAQALKKEEFKKLKKKNKLTFDCDQDEDTYRVKSSHDLLKDQSLSNQLAVKTDDLVKKKKQREEEEQRAKQLKDKILKNDHEKGEDSEIIALEELKKKRKLNEEPSQRLIQDEILNYRTVFNPSTKKNEVVWGLPEVAEQGSEGEGDEEEEKLKRVRELQREQFENLKSEELNFKKIKEGSNKSKRKMLLDQEIALLSNSERMRYEFVKKANQSKVENSLNDRLAQFTNKLQSNNTWMKHALKFHIDSDNAYRLDEKKRLLHQDQDDLDDGGLKIEIDKTEPLEKEFDVDELYDLIHNDQ